MTNAATRLAWHQERRGRGVPTVSAFVGPPGLGVRAWRAWAADRAVAQTASPDPGALARAWLAAAGDLAPAAESWVLRQPWGGGARLADATAHDLATLRREADPDDRAAAVAFAVLAARAAATPVAWPDPVDAAAGTYGLAPPAGWPALLVVPAAGDDGAAARSAARFAVAAPGVPVAVCLTAEAFARLAADPSREAALAREGEVRVPFVSPAEVADRLRAAGADPAPLADAIGRAAARGLTHEGADLFARAATAPAAPDESEYRSAAEEFLHELLESLPETAGLFRPNRPLPFRHGSRLGEADLLAEALKLAVEVDGAYYHLTEEQYRRDRVKDRLYARHGYLVLRFLAEDVVPRSDEVLTAILEAVSHRRATPPNGGPHRA